MPDVVTLQPGYIRQVVLPDIIDPEGDKVNIVVKYDGQIVSNEIGCEACYVRYNAEETTIDIFFPHDYQFELDKLSMQNETEELIFRSEEPKQVVTFFDDRGDLVEVEIDTVPELKPFVVNT